MWGLCGGADGLRKTLFIRMKPPWKRASVQNCSRNTSIHVSHLYGRRRPHEERFRIRMRLLRMPAEPFHRTDFLTSLASLPSLNISSISPCLNPQRHTDSSTALQVFIPPPKKKKWKWYSYGAQTSSVSCVYINVTHTHTWMNPEVIPSLRPGGAPAWIIQQTDGSLFSLSFYFTRLTPMWPDLLEKIIFNKDLLQVVQQFYTFLM